MTDQDPIGSFIRWQSITIAQLTYAVNLILGFSVAVLAFQITLILNPVFNPASWQKCIFLLSLFLIVISVVLGISCVINRLRDFRATAKAARLREQNAPKDEILPYRILYKRLGKFTWGLFWWQIITFGASVILTAIVTLSVVSDKIS